MVYRGTFWGGGKDVFPHVFSVVVSSSHLVSSELLTNRHGGAPGSVKGVAWGSAGRGHGACTGDPREPFTAGGPI